MKRKTFRLGQYLNPGPQLYALVLYQLSHPVEYLDLGRMFPRLGGSVG